MLGYAYSVIKKRGVLRSKCAKLYNHVLTCTLKYNHVESCPEARYSERRIDCLRIKLLKFQLMLTINVKIMFFILQHFVWG